MSHEDEVCLKFGRMIVGMIRELKAAVGDDGGFSRQRVTFRCGSIELFVVSTEELASTFEDAARLKYTVVNATPKSEIN